MAKKYTKEERMEVLKLVYPNYFYEPFFIF